MTRSNIKSALRSIVSFALTFNALMLAITGIMLFILPQGRIAHWNAFTIWGQTKEQWEAIHVGMAILFLIAFPLHLYLNWKPFYNYLKSKTAILAGVLVLVVFFIVGASSGIRPFGSVMAISDRAREGWETTAPPLPHYELKTIGEVIVEQGLDQTESLDELAGMGITNPALDSTLAELAAKHNTSPVKIYLVMGGKPKEKKGQKNK